MSEETKAPTKEDVERWDEVMEEEISGYRGQQSWERINEALRGLTSAALLGTQVQGLREELAGVTANFDRAANGLVLATKQVSALQARVAELEGTLATESAERVRCRDGWAQCQSERDALRAQMKRARDAFGDISTTFEAKPLWGPPQDGLSSKMAKAIDYAWGVAREQYAALSAPHAETPAPERVEGRPCLECGHGYMKHHDGAGGPGCSGGCHCNGYVFK
jgi:hypothetical protein